jgi:DNA-binding transcriptional MerR regulator
VAGSSEERVVLVDTQAAAVAVDRPESTIRRWAHEGRFTRKGTDGGGRALYSLADVYRAAIERRAGS